MSKGLLEVSGSIDLSQFWPQGESDGDTVKVTLAGASPFRFQAVGGAFKVTHAFDNATVEGKVSKPAIDKQGRVTIRLQGIDATELHYRPTAPNKPTAAQRAAFNAANGNFRQNFGETAAVALHDFLAKAGGATVSCVVRTAVDQPGDVFDTFGRLVGDIFVKISGAEKDANLWMCENGWAFPTFYASMSNDEINTLITLSETARAKKLGIWKKASSDLAPFDPTLVFRSHGTPDPLHDVGPVIMPKMFRRRSTFASALKAKIVQGNFKDYLVGTKDACYQTADFLSQGLAAATHRTLDEFVTPQSKFTVLAKDLVFQEAASRVVGPDGKPVVW